MATIGSLNVAITANTAGFVKGTQKAQALAGGFVAKVTGMGNAMTTLGRTGNVVAGAMTAAFGMVAGAAIEAGGKISELTKKLRVTSEEITALHYAAEQLESSAEAVDDALAKMAISLGKGLGGSKEMTAAFGELGLNIQQLSKLSRANQFLAVIEGLHNIKDESVQAAVAQKILGRGSKELAALYAAGAAKIVEAAGEAAAAGTLMGGKTTNALDDSGDAVKRLTGAWKAFRDEAVAGLQPAIQYLAWSTMKSMQAVKLVFDGVKAFLAGTKEVAHLTVQGIVELLNSILPKSMKISTETIDRYAKAYAANTAEHTNKFARSGKAYLGLAPAQDNPLTTPAPSTAVEKNTAATNDTLQLLLAEMRKQNGGRSQQPAQQPPAQIAISGMR